ncbi:hypothetical protein TPA0906_66460 [Streptomyces olivaceus]|nr:hypothetical protein TPA0906_66460 [Streptomyces olivaceus]
MFSLLRTAQREKVQVGSAQPPDQALLRADVEQVVSSSLSSCDLRVYDLIRAEQALIRGTYFA